MARVERSYRLFGKFKMGRQNDPKHAREILGDCLEIFHVPAEQPSGKIVYHSLARVSVIADSRKLPKRITAAFANKVPSERNVFLDAGREEIETALLKLAAPGDSISFWIHEPAKDGNGGQRLYLFGPVWLDQFVAGTSERPSRRFPLVSSIGDATKASSTSVCFGSGETWDIRLAMLFAMPVALGTGLSSKAQEGGGLGLTILVLTTGKGLDLEKDPDALLRPNIIMCAPPGLEKHEDVRNLDWIFGDYAISANTAGVNTIPGKVRFTTPHFEHVLGALGFRGQKIETTPPHVIEFLSARSGGDDESHLYTVCCRASMKLYAGDGVEIIGGKALLDLDARLGGWLKLKDRTLTVECHWTVLLTDELLFSALADPDKTSVQAGGYHLSLRFDTEVKEGFIGGSDSPVGRDRLILTGAGLEEAARFTNVARAAIVATDRQPQSALPELQTMGGPGTVTLPVIAYPSGSNLSFQLGKTPLLQLPDELAQIGFTPDTEIINAEPGNGRQLSRRHLTKIPGVKGWKPPAVEALVWRLPPTPADPIRLRMRLPAFDDRETGTTDGHEHHHVFLGYDAEVDAGSSDSRSVISFAFGNDTDSASTPHGADKEHFGGLQSRLGSLQFERRGPLLQPVVPDGKTHGGQLRLRRRRRPAPDPRRAAAAAATMELEWLFRLQLDKVYPVTTDIPHGTREDRPSDLLIREAQDSGADLAFVLILTETLNDSRDRHLEASLEEWSAQDETAAYETFTVLTEAPFSLYRFSRLPLSVNTGKAVAGYDSDMRAWTLKSVSPTYRFTRPAGAVGEDADKPGRLELHDAQKREEAVAPALPDSGDGVPRRYAVDTRFSPPTDLWIDPSDLQRNFNLPEYAARELFRQRGDFGLGVRFTALRGELLYGLAHSIQPASGLDAGPGPRVAELETLTGSMVLNDLHEREVPIRKRWTSLRAALRQRPERLEIWTLDTRRKDPFVPARFDQGVQAAMRSTALLAPPVALGEQDSGSVPEGLQPPRLHEHGLSGGVLWPIESANITRILRRNPEATGAEVDGLVLSPMGNSGNQTVRFLNNYVTIITETRDGFLQKQRVEILGRIAGLWHPAKHVVIYERTTAPSPQFAPHPDQPTRSRRPALRKVEEFVEILQPVRRFPDMDNIPLRSRGCMEEVRFNSTVIHVNSAWGHDVEDYGWEVPLWNRGEAELRPQIYPYPDVAVVTTGEGAGDRPQAVQECQDVANLYFYTDPKAAEVEVRTDRWPVRYGIDTSAMGSAEVLRTVVGLDETGAPPAERSRRTAAGRVLPGLRRFTLRLAPSDVKSRINAERGDKPVFSGLASITIMRSPGEVAKNGKVKKHLDAFSAAVKKIGGTDELRDLVRGDVALPLTAANPVRLAQYDTVLQSIEDLRKQATAPTKAQLEGFRTTLATLTDIKVVSDIEDALSNGEKILTKVTAFVGQDSDLAEVFRTARDFDEKDCNELADKAAEAIRRRRLMYVALMEEARKDFARRVNAAAGDTLTREEARAWLIEAITNESDAFFDETARNLGELRSGVATVRAIAADWRTDVHVSMDKARGRLDAFERSYDRNKPWSRNRIDAAFAALAAELDSVELEAEHALDELRTRAATEIGVSANAVGARVAKAIRQTMGLGTAAFHTFDSVEVSVTKGVASAKSAIGKLPSQEAIEARLKEIDAQIAKIKDAGAKAKAEAALKKVRDAANALKLDDLKADATNLVAAAEASAKQSIDEIRSLNERLLDEAKAILQRIAVFSDAAHDAAADLTGDTLKFVQGLVSGLGAEARVLLAATEAELHRFLKTWKNEQEAFDEAVGDARAWVEANTRLADRATEVGLAAADAWLREFETRVAAAAQAVNSSVRTEFGKQVVHPVVDGLFETVPWPGQDEIAKAKALALDLSDQFVEQVEVRLNALEKLPLQGVEQAKAACATLAGIKARLLQEADEVKEAARAELEAALKSFSGTLDEVIADISKWETNGKAILDGADKLLGTVNEIGNQIADAGDNVRAYLDRGMDILARAGEAKPGAMPGVALQFISAATQAPEIAALKVNADRIRVLLDDARDVLETPVVQAGLDRLGDALKALGLEFDFQEFGDRFVPNFKGGELLTRLLPDLGGINLRDMLPNAHLPKDLKEIVRLTHDLDAKAGRAWVQADLDVPLPGRQPMFSIGPFTLYLRDTRLTAFLRADAGKDSEEVAVTDRALMLTTIEVVVGGQVMVTLQDVMITYSSEDKLNFTLDPRKIQIHKAMRFIQDTLGSIFGDELGGLVFIKENGIPVGVEHKFAIPPLSLMYGTSGVSNLQISNRFSLRAYPDFVIANRFNLSRRELPFLFTIFIIGGTGYIQVDTEYRPFDKQLMVAVEAGLGGSAALGFALGPVSGGVFISISIVLRYQKTIGNAPNGEDGLSVSVVLVIAGSVSLWGIVTVYLGLMLSISYHDSGKIDGLGQLSVEVRISRWFKLRFSSQVKYKLRDGQATTQVETDTTTSGKYMDAIKKFEALKKTRAAL